MSSRARAATALAAVAVVAAGAAGGIHAISSGSGATLSHATLTITASAYGRPVPQGFEGLSMEPRGLASYGGSNPRAPNPVFEQLLRNLAAGGRASLRVGGDGTDWTWWPVPGMARPPGVKFDLTPAWLGVARGVAQATNARLILGVNLEANSTTVAGAETQAMLGGIGRQWIEGLEIGNEPELYSTFPWYKAANGQHVKGRAPGYDFPGFVSDFSRTAAAVPHAPLAGPSTGAPKWIPLLGRFLSLEPRVAVATLHRYPLKHCSRATHITIARLLSNSASSGLAASIARYVRVAHDHHVPLRIDEMNAISCGGERGVSDTFASALWALDTLFEMARVGVDGVNFHTVPRTINELISADYSAGRWRSLVHPQYYGMMMFVRAAPPGSRLLQVRGRSGPGLHVWATKASDGEVRVVLINESTDRSEAVKVRIASRTRAASLSRLEAPALGATSGVTLGGQSFGSSTFTGLLSGRSSMSAVAPAGGVYAVRIPPGSAAMLTVPAG